MAPRRARKKIGEWGRLWQRVQQVLGDSLENFLAEDSLTISASIAYYTLLSVFPLMLLLLGLTSIYFSRYEQTGRLAIVLESHLPMKPDFIIRNLVLIMHSYGRVTLISVLLLLWSSSGVFLPLEKALNRAWDVEKGRSWWRSHLLALEMTLILSFLILASSGLVGVNIYVHNWVEARTFHSTRPFLDIIFHTSVSLLSFGMTVAMFIVLFERLPHRPMQFRQVIPSALVTALFWEAARSLFTILLPYFNYHHVYGSIGVVVALMTWAYISSVVTLFGAQVSRALYRTLEASETISAVSAVPAVQPRS